jgi:asparagine synthase (glutamine-hydrolysing)
MPGILGIISKRPSKDIEHDVQRMVESMLHESSYKSGIYTNPDLGVYAGWVCHQNSFSDCMPIWNEKKSAVLLFSGENFTDLDLFDHLKARHHRFNRSNASYLIHLYEEKGIDFLKGLNGCFSGLLVDIQAEIALLFNDRFGTQRVYYYQSKDSFFFASEAKSLLRVCPELRSLDMKSTGEFISCDCVLENRTMFKSVFILPSASSWQFSPNTQLKKKYYFTLDEWENQPWLDKEFFYNKLNTTLTKIFPRYMRSSDQQIGISLSGGLGSRVLLANMEMSPGKYPCYTFGQIKLDSYDVNVARKIATAYQQTHHTLHLGNEFLSDFQSYAEKFIYVSDGHSDVSNSYFMQLNNLAKNIAPIKITGKSGNLLLRGKEKSLRPMQSFLKTFNPDVRIYIQTCMDTLSDLYATSRPPLTNYLLYEVPWLHSVDFMCEQLHLTSRIPYLDNDLVALMYRAPMGHRKDKEILSYLASAMENKSRGISTGLGFRGHIIMGLTHFNRFNNNLIRKAKSAFGAKIPPWHTMTQIPFSAMCQLDQFRSLYRDALSDYVKCILLDPGTIGRQYTNRKMVQKIVHKHVLGVWDYTKEIDRLLTLELIHKLFIENH